MIRYMYIVEDEQGKRTAHEGMRSAKFHAFQRKLTGKPWRVSVAMPSGRKLYAALYNQEDASLTDWEHGDAAILPVQTAYESLIRMIANPEEA